ncbi:MAG: HupE/UreJ family protein [Acidimicrobiia bacterium]|nr:HupE/UreJ family protein [Acidimicrobiia bacterium]
MRPAVWFVSIVAAVAIVASLPPVSAHEIPVDVTVRAYVKPDGDTLRMIVRVPLESFRDVIIPTRNEVYLDFEKSAGAVHAGALLWIAQGTRFLEDGGDLGSARIAALRVTLPSDPFFDSYEAALANVHAPPLPATTDLVWTQALVDVLLEYPIRSDRSRFAFETEFARLGLRTETVIYYVTPDADVRFFRYTGNPGLVQLDPRWTEAARRFVVSGVEHILEGIDHLLFLLCLVVPFRQFRPLLLIVTAFTVGHSVTLASAALGWVPAGLWFPPFIETLIAASIVWMAFENIASTPSVRRRWILALVFGLAHGFGFSFALAESLQFGGEHLVMSLLAFNVGVELGQVAAVLVFVPLLAVVFRYIVAERIGGILISAVVAHQAWHWMEERGADFLAHDIPAPTAEAWTWIIRAVIAAWVLGGGLWLMRMRR